MLKVIKDLLLKIINNIDSGNSNITEDDSIQIIKALKQYTDKDIKMSKYQAMQYLNMSRASFDNKVREGLIPEGIKEQGFKEKFYLKRNLDDYIKLYKK